jgi:hypothetical protein
VRSGLLKIRVTSAKGLSLPEGCKFSPPDPEARKREADTNNEK